MILTSCLKNRIRELDSGSTQVKADFYSYLDKTISLTVLEKVQYILRLNNQTNSFRWLYFIKETLGVETEINLFNIYVPR